MYDVFQKDDEYVCIHTAYSRKEAREMTAFYISIGYSLSYYVCVGE